MVQVDFWPPIFGKKMHLRIKQIRCSFSQFTKDEPTGFHCLWKNCRRLAPHPLCIGAPGALSFKGRAASSNRKKGVAKRNHECMPKAPSPMYTAQMSPKNTRKSSQPRGATWRQRCKLTNYLHSWLREDAWHGPLAAVRHRYTIGTVTICIGAMALRPR